jgi:hypothetical protein
VKIFRSEQRSLFGEILDWMLTPLLLLWPISLVLTWLVAQSVAGKPFDRALQYNVNELSTLVRVAKGQVQFSLPQPARQLLRADDADTVYYQILGARGEYLSGERDLPLPADDEGPFFGEVRIRDGEFRGIDVRVAYTWVRLDLPGARPALVQVAESLDKRAVLATEIVKGVMLPQFVILPLAVLLVWVGLAYAIKPLNRLEERIRARSPDDLSPLDEHSIPQEVAPLVASVNDLLMRLKNSISHQKRFLADAAHQLKTPLAGLRMQADLAQREGANADELKQSLRQIGSASQRATHTVNQLLALARAESGGATMARQPCDLAQLTIEVVQDCLPRHPKYQELKAKRTSFGWVLTIAMMVVYYGFILLVAFNKEFLATKLGDRRDDHGHAHRPGRHRVHDRDHGHLRQRANSEFDEPVRRHQQGGAEMRTSSKLVLGAAALCGVSWPLAAGADLGQAEKQATNWTAIGMFGIFVVFTLFITKWAAAKTKSAADFYTAGGGITGFQNGLAIAGDYMSAASFLGISAAVMASGFDGLIYSIGFLVGWPVVTFLLAERLRNLGKFTFADVAAFRFSRRRCACSPPAARWWWWRST